MIWHRTNCLHRWLHQTESISNTFLFKVWMRYLQLQLKFVLFNFYAAFFDSITVKKQDSISITVHIVLWMQVYVRVRTCVQVCVCQCGKYQCFTQWGDIGCPHIHLSSISKALVHQQCRWCTLYHHKQPQTCSGTQPHQPSQKTFMMCLS